MVNWPTTRNWLIGGASKPNGSDTSFYFGMTVGAHEHALRGLGSCVLEGPADPLHRQSERLLRRVEMVELPRAGEAVVAAEDAAAPGLLDQARLTRRRRAVTASPRHLLTPKAPARTAADPRGVAVTAALAEDHAMSLDRMRRRSSAHRPKPVAAKPVPDGGRADTSRSAICWTVSPSSTSSAIDVAAGLALRGVPLDVDGDEPELGRPVRDRGGMLATSRAIDSIERPAASWVSSQSLSMTRTLVRVPGGIWLYNSLWRIASSTRWRSAASVWTPASSPVRAAVISRSRR